MPHPSGQNLFPSGDRNAGKQPRLVVRIDGGKGFRSGAILKVKDDDGAVHGFVLGQCGACSMKFFTVTFQIFDVGRTIVQSYMLMVLLVDTVNNEYPTIALFN